MSTKVDRIYEIDDGLMSNAEIAKVVGCHVAYVRSVRSIAKRNSARRAAINSSKKLQQKEDLPNDNSFAN